MGGAADCKRARQLCCGGKAAAGPDKNFISGYFAGGSRLLWENRRVILFMAAAPESSAAAVEAGIACSGKLAENPA